MRHSAAVLVWLAFFGLHAHAHPILSTDINRHVTLRISAQRVEVRYVYEMLEIAAINVARAADSDGDGRTSDAERDAYVARWSAEWSSHIHLTLDGNPLSPITDSVNWVLGPAPFGLNTWKISAQLSAPVSGFGIAKFEYRDEFRPQEAGWKEIVLLHGGSVQVQTSNVGAEDRSKALTDYQAMADLTNPEQRTVSAQLRFSNPTQVAARPPQKQRPKRKTRSPPNLEAEQSSQPSQAAAPRQMTDPDASAASEDFAPLQSAWHHYAWPFFRLGMYHIAIGWDHLAFLLGLLLFRQSLGRLAMVVSAFTLAHSLTLALAALGWVNPPGKAVEALIAVSIAYVGAVSLWRPGVKHGPVIAFGFGLIHGFGFAGALAESLGEVDGQSWLFALAGFNVGIEVFQLALVSLVFPLMHVMDRFRWSPWLRKGLSCLVIGLGLWWTVERVAGI